MTGIDLPRGRFTDALVAFSLFAALFALIGIGLDRAAGAVGFVPLEITSGAWSANPVVAALSPLASQFVQPDLLSMLFNLVFLLIAGRFVERAVSPLGLATLFVAGAYGGALARLVLTPGSGMVGIGSTPALFAIIGAYLMLYGLPRAIPIAPGNSRLAQIGIVAAVWLAIQLAFSLASGMVEVSASIVAPLGGLAAGVALAQPLLRWRYRRA